MYRIVVVGAVVSAFVACSTATDPLEYQKLSRMAEQHGKAGESYASEIYQLWFRTRCGAPSLGKGRPLDLIVEIEYDCTDHPIDLARYQLAGCYMGRIGLINSGGASSGDNDFRDAARTAVINKRAGGTGLISGRKAFQRPMDAGVKLLNTIQDVYLDASIGLA